MALNDQQFTDGGIRENVALASNVSAAGNYPADAATVYGGDYIARVFAPAWNGATAKLQFLDADGTTYSDLLKADGTAAAPFSANGQIAIGLGSNSRVRLVVTGTPTGLYANLSRLP